MNEVTILEGLANAVINGEEEKVVELVRIAIEEKCNLLKAIDDGLVKGIQILGKRFGEGEVFLPELVMGANAMKAGNSLLNTEIIKTGLERKILGKVVIGTVKGDIHDIGKTLVGTMLSVNGFEVIDLGVDNTAKQFMEVVRKEKADIVGLSSLLTTTMTYMSEVIKNFEKAGTRDKVKIMIGGAPVSEEFAKQIGADGYGYNAQQAVEVAKQLMKKRGDK